MSTSKKDQQKLLSSKSDISLYTTHYLKLLHFTRQDQEASIIKQSNAVLCTYYTLTCCRRKVDFISRPKIVR